MPVTVGEGTEWVAGHLERRFELNGLILDHVRTKNLTAVVSSPATAEPETHLLARGIPTMVSTSPPPAIASSPTWSIGKSSNRPCQSPRSFNVNTPPSNR